LCVRHATSAQYLPSTQVFPSADAIPTANERRESSAPRPRKAKSIAGKHLSELLKRRKRL
jgi:hypothetical protein